MGRMLAEVMVAVNAGECVAVDRGVEFEYS